MTANPYWTEYFEKVAKDGPAWIDYSNERVQLQTFGAVLEVSDSLLDRRVLDIGCGRGALCRLAQVLGAREVTGIDLASESLAELAKQHEGITWKAGDVTLPEFRAELGTFDVIYSLESMQYLPVPECFDWVHDMLAPGGRFVTMFPYEHCPIVADTKARFGGKYMPPSLDAIADWADAQTDVVWCMRGLRFQEDQRIAAYATSSWTTRPNWTQPPNRIQLVMQRGKRA